MSRVRVGPPGPRAGFLLLAFAYAVSWVMALVGAFVPIENFPGPLKAFAEWNPVSTVTQASRELFGNVLPAAGMDGVPWSLRHPITCTLLWIVGLTAVFAPLSIARFRRVGAR